MYNIEILTFSGSLLEVALDMQICADNGYR